MTDLRSLFADGPLPHGAVWVHAASVGEVNAARPVIASLCRRHPVIVTATTPGGVAAALQWDLPDVTSRLAPLDLGWVTRRFIRKCGLKTMVIVENELWPARILACHAAKVPVVLINARMSPRSADRWRRFRGVISRALAPMALVSPQDENSAKRLQALGAVQLGPVCDLKALYQAKDAPVPAELAQVQRDGIVLAAATHKGEESIVLEAFRIAQAKQPHLQLILAPRHPDRAGEVAALIHKAGFEMTQRSKGETLTAPVFLADTLGEMHLWYQLARCAFVGGSLVPRGAHTPYEPAAYGCGIIVGPDQRNFARPFQWLLETGAATRVSDAMELAKAFETTTTLPARDTLAREMAGNFTQLETTLLRLSGAERDS